ncbi:peptidoglycan-recognition protein SC1a/b-like [Euwallacea similis]|uniref:peptidoglycan-recognition protein SC1a/b-like n=1 Tax=Euwallacea similis TaxID=1736056 RepID=UPI00344C7954
MVRILHTSSSNCSDYQTCANKILGLQGQHVVNDGAPDIAYNFLIGGDGNIYLGRGADVSNDQRPDAYDVAYVGNYLAPYDKVNDKMDKAGRRLLKRLLERGKLDKDYVVVAYNQTERVNSPGENVFKRVMLWPHYKPGLYFELSKEI